MTVCIRECYALSMIAQEAERSDIDLRVCGEMAGDPMCVTILIGLGFRHLSMNGRSVARVKYLLRRIDYEEAKILAQRSLEAQLATEVRHQVAAFMERRGMGGLIRGVVKALYRSYIFPTASQNLVCYHSLLWSACK